MSQQPASLSKAASATARQPSSTPKKQVLIGLMSIYVLLLASECINFTFFPVYFSRDLGMNNTQVGLLISIGSVVTIFAQNFWGVQADRSRSKNRVLALVILGTGLFSLFFLFPSLHHFWSLFVMIAVMYVFFLSEQSLLETIALEKTLEYGFSYGPIRCAGSIGYGLCALIVSFIPGVSILQMFVAFTLLTFAMLLPLRLVPKTPGLQAKEKRAGMFSLFRYPVIRTFMIYVLILYTVLNFSFTFFSVRFSELDGSNGLLALFVAVGTAVQIPLLLFAEKLFARFNFYHLFLFVGFMTALRLVILGLITDVRLLCIPYVMQSALGVIFVYCGVLFINYHVPPQLRATGQSLWLIMIAGVSVVLGNTFGGMISDGIGSLPASFFLFAGVVLVLSLLFCYIFRGRTFRLEKPNASSSQP